MLEAFSREYHTVCWKLLYADDLMIIAGAEEFGRVGVHQGSDLSLFLFIIMLEALSREFHTVCWKLLYADDLMIIAEDLRELLLKFEIWISGKENVLKFQTIVALPNGA